ncbi:PP2C family protein-serine/threonine phosphatase [Azospirillum griseum]|uniref:Fused response regulator/phosphatase n=1 Tax=Azospirillum griseum TaxID=2496639 RepID=A0A431VDQ5_9PROT|nr:fused response regulator/phosphatase [Azospirillum griseum]RTR17265.1 fused response regulator/phosphatase [Azospirillum griseum]
MPEPPRRQGTILVVDDDDVSRMMMESVLRRGGFASILTARSGEEALTILSGITPDCVLLDVVMPGIDGFEVCRHIRATPRTAGVPVIIQTALDGAKDRQNAFRAGATDVLVKPLEAYELIARVSVHTANRMMTARLEEYHHRMEAELEEAQGLMAALPPDTERLEEFRALGIAFNDHLRPSSAIGGDYWTAWPFEDGRVGFFAGDVSGHGVSAALRAFLLHSLLVPPPTFAEDPVLLAAHLDRRIHQAFQGSRHFVAGVIGILDPVDGVLAYVGGGFRDGFIRRADGSSESVPLSGLPFGLVPDMPRSVRVRPLVPGDALVLFSDAVVEIADHPDAPADADAFRLWAMAMIAQENPPLDQLAQRLGDRFAERFGDHVSDDLMILSAAITRPPDMP